MPLSPSERYERDIALAGRQLAHYNIPYKQVVWFRDYFLICFEQADGKRGLMNMHGRMIQPADCAAIHINAHDCFIVQDFITGKWGLIDSSGQVLIPRILDDCEEVTDYYDAYAPLYRCRTEGKWALYDLSGKPLTEPLLLKTHWNPVAPDVIWAQTASKQWQTLTLEGRPCGDGPFDSMKEYANGMVVQKKDLGYAFYNHDGTPITGFLYRDAYGFRDAETVLEKARAIGLPEGLTLVGSATERYGTQVWIDNQGQEHLIKH
jgi:hypothetical protein